MFPVVVAVHFQPPPLGCFPFPCLCLCGRGGCHSGSWLTCCNQLFTVPYYTPDSHQPSTTAYQRRLHNLSAPDRCLTHCGITPSLLSIIQLFPQTLNVLLTCFFLCSRITLRPPSCHHQPPPVAIPAGLFSLLLHLK